MVTTEQLIERLGGGGTVGVALAAVVLAPTLLPPVRRGLRGLAKGVIVQYLRVTEPRIAAGPGAQEDSAAAVPTRQRRRGQRAAGAGAGGEQPASAETPQPRRRRGQEAASRSEEGAPERAGRGSRSRGAASARGEDATRASNSRSAAAAPAETPAPAQAEPQEAQRGRRTSAASDGKVNLNTATRAELTKLPRVGAQTADRIIQFREEQGRIRSLAQLRQADIIPVSARRAIRDLVRF